MHLNLGRRATVTLAIAGSLLHPIIGRAATTDVARPDTATLYKKLRYRADDGLLFWWLDGTKFGQMDADIRPLFGMKVGTMARVKNQPDGTFTVTTLEIVFYTDLETGAFLKQWTNPYTGAVIPVSHAPLGPTTLSHNRDGMPIRNTMLGGNRITARSDVHPLKVVVDDVWLAHDSTASVERDGGKSPPFLVNDWSTYLGKLSELSDPANTVGTATVYLQEATGWAKWMGMDRKPGNQVARAVGKKVLSYDEMPDDWRALMAATHPNIVRNPAAALDAPEAKFDR